MTDIQRSIEDLTRRDVFAMCALMAMLIRGESFEDIIEDAWAFADEMEKQR